MQTFFQEVLRNVQGDAGTAGHWLAQGAKLLMDAFLKAVEHSHSLVDSDDKNTSGVPRDPRLRWRLAALRHVVIG